MSFSFLSLLLVFNVSAVDKCEYLPEYTCSSAILNDGTGNMTRTDQSAERRLELTNGSMTQLTRDFQRALLSTESPVSEYDLQIALSATGNVIAPACTNSRIDENDTRPTFACARLLATSLATRANADIFDNSYYGREPLEDATLLRNSLFYQNILNNQRDRLRASSESQILDTKIEQTFSSSVGFINEVIDSKIADSRTRTLLKNKINSIKYQGTDCSEPNGNFNVNEVFRRNANYNSETNTFRYCRGMADFGMSEYHLMHIITHELVHSIDPCRIQTGPRSMRFSYNTDSPSQEYPFQILQCLRSEGSIQAYDPNNRERPQRKMQGGGMGYPADSPYPDGRGFMTRSASPAPERQPFCDSRDQINESFCDWLGTEVLYRHMNTNLAGSTQQQHIDGIAGIWRPLCQGSSGIGGSSLGRPGSSPHPALRDRLSHITLAHPGIRRKLGCAPLNNNDDVKYCSFTKGQTEVVQPPTNYPPIQGSPRIEDIEGGGSID